MTFTFRGQVKKDGTVLLPLGDRQFEQISEGDWVWIHAHKIHQPGDGFADQVIENVKELIADYQAGNHENYSEIVRKLTEYFLNEKGAVEKFIKGLQMKWDQRPKQPTSTESDAKMQQMMLLMNQQQREAQQLQMEMMMQQLRASEEKNMRLTEMMASGNRSPPYRGVESEKKPDPNYERSLRAKELDVVRARGLLRDLEVQIASSRAFANKSFIVEMEMVVSMSKLLRKDFVSVGTLDDVNVEIEKLRDLDLTPNSEEE